MKHCRAAALQIDVRHGGVEQRTWIVADLDPDVLARVRENPGFPLSKRCPETYGELTIRS